MPSEDLFIDEQRWPTIVAYSSIFPLKRHLSKVRCEKGEKTPSSVDGEATNEAIVATTR